MKYKQTSINIEIDLFDKIENLKLLTGSDLNTSKIINLALREFFETNSVYNEIISQADESILVPIDKYAQIFSVSKKTVKSKIQNGSIQSIKLGELEYIKLAENDIKNIFIQLINLKSRVENLEKKVK
ncbi:hypothetical protein [Sulfurimonas indica]|uniref:hypothetical protein n=1 Tax=Sulfurimonas TaxID=202746 RepID=UPI0012641C6D|nr:hypothetical protein [Sulfurimonas indica]